ncbi:hypothetical protein TNCT_132871 [Trichonephila clavata]|uniref:Uncharacterized protein n=1 Tax=Trichonephila clavata TaxID=2740835 RepID=A0A8X6L6K3_TRICU|nr:hypothetical protein TNCT_132871 [Trichonephila clavata]
MSDGLAYGTVGKLCHIDVSYNESVNSVWLEFPESSKSNQKWRKGAAYVEQHISKSAVPMARRTSTVKMNNKTISVIRFYLPIVSACAPSLFIYLKVVLSTIFRDVKTHSHTHSSWYIEQQLTTARPSLFYKS